MYTMQDLCPLCLKNGIKKKTKLLQINLQEAIFVCEEEKCTWPFGCEDFIFYSRPVGKIWSCYWDDQKPILSKLRENVISTKPGLDNLNLDDFTTSYNAPNDYSKNTEINSNTNRLKTNNQLINSTYENPDISYNNQDQQIKSVNICTSINNCNVRVTNGNMRDAETGNENINLPDKHVKEKRDLCVQNSQSINNVKGIPKITNIKKTNISIPNGITGHYTSVNHDSKEKIVCISKLADNVGYKLTSVSSDKQFPQYLPKCEKLTNLTSPRNELSNSSLITTALSDETPAYSSTHKAITSNMQQIENKNIVGGGVINDAKLNTLVDNTSVMLPNVARGKRYQKFSFSAIKKKMESQNTSDTNSNNVNSLCAKSNLRIQDVANNLQNSVKKEIPTENSNNNEKVETCNIDCKQIITHKTTNYLPNEINHSETVNNLLAQENVSADISANTSLNIDTVLEDLITNDYVSKDINDEWIDSLLT